MADGDAWTTGPHDSRERTCGHRLGTLSVRHVFRSSRDPDPTGTTVTRTHEVTVEWPTDGDLAGWLSAVADRVAPYDADRFGAGGGYDDHDAADHADHDDAGDRRGDADGGRGADGGRPTDDAHGGGDAGRPPGSTRPDAATDGRFLAAPTAATVAPAGSGPLSGPCRYRNTPLARVRADPGFPDRVRSLSVEVDDGPRARWAGAGPTAGGDDGQRASPTAALSAVGRERFRAPPADGGADDHGDDDADGDPGDHRAYRAVGDATPPSLPGLVELVADTVDGPTDAATAAARRLDAHLGRTWRRFRADTPRPHGVGTAVLGVAADVPADADGNGPPR